MSLLDQLQGFMYIKAVPINKFNFFFTFHRPNRNHENTFLFTITIRLFRSTASCRTSPNVFIFVNVIHYISAISCTIFFAVVFSWMWPDPTQIFLVPFDSLFTWPPPQLESMKLLETNGFPFQFYSYRKIVASQILRWPNILIHTCWLLITEFIYLALFRGSYYQVFIF